MLRCSQATSTEADLSVFSTPEDLPAHIEDIFLGRLSIEPKMFLSLINFKACKKKELIWS